MNRAESEPRAQEVLSVALHDPYFAGALQFPPREPRGISLRDTNLSVTRQEVEGGAEYSVTFEHPSLQGESLFNLLKLVAPGKGFDSLGGAYFDWILPDSQPGDGIHGGEEGDRLRKLHTEGLGQHWADFEISRRDLMDAITSGYDPTSLLRFFSGKQIVLHNQEGLQKRLDAGKLDFPMLRRMFQGEQFPDPTATIAGYMLEDGSISEKTHNRILDGNKRQTMSAIFDQNRDEYRSRYLAELDDDQRAKAFDNYVRSEYVELTLEDGTHGYVSRTGIHGATSEALHEAYHSREASLINVDNGRFLIQSGAFAIDKATIQTQNGPKEIVFPTTLRPAIKSLSLQPVLQWRTSELDYGRLHREVVVDAQRDNEVEYHPVDQPRRKPSKLIGLLTLAYVSPELIRDWPESIKLGNSKPQRIGVAQVPVLALMKRKSLAKSPLLERIEKLF